MVDKISVVIVGMGGYGNRYVNALLDADKSYEVEIKGGVDPYPEGCQRLEEIKRKNIPLFSSLEEFYKNNRADLAVISSPIHYHQSQISLALDNDSHVLCEKPLAPTVDAARDIVEKANKYNKKVAIGYQWSFSRAINRLKKDIMKGLLGKPLRLKTLVLWPRDFAYYNRNKWAGRIKNEKGQWIMDSVAHNATAHYLHNMLYVLGDEIDKSAKPVFLETEIYRANDIENFDTAAARIKTRQEAQLLYLVSHATKNQINPEFVYEFEKGRVEYSQDGKIGEITAFFYDGKEKVYGDPFNNVNNKLWFTIEAIINDKKIWCGPEAAFPQVVCINGIQQSDILNFPPDMIEYIKGNKEKKSLFVRDLDNTFINCYHQWKLPHELNLSWTRRGERVDLEELFY
ncbi:MAG: Gfo/Idh/MocA family protein [Halanaerobiales bacterium]